MLGHRLKGILVDHINANIYFNPEELNIRSELLSSCKHAFNSSRQFHSGTMNEEEILRGIKKEIMQSDKDYISEHLKAVNHCSFLQEKDVLTQEDCDVIEKEASDKEKADKLLEIMILKGPSSFDYLCDSLQHEDTQQFLLERLKQKFELRKQFLLDVYAAKENRPRKVPTSLPIASIDLSSQTDSKVLK